MPFTPPFFGDFGKAAKDLAEKEFDYVNKVTVKRSTTCGLKVETSVTSGASLSGNVKLNYKEKGLGDFTCQHDTDGTLKLKGKFTELTKGAVLTVEPALKKGKWNVASAFDYSQDNFAATAKWNLAEVVKDEKKAFESNFSLAGVAGTDGLSFGCKLDFAPGASSPDVGLGFNYAESDFAVTLLTTDKPANVNAQLYHKVNADLQTGFSFASPSNVVTFANQYQFDKSTMGKYSYSTSGCVQTALQHTLANPNATVNLAASFSTKNGYSDFKSEKYGLSFTLGDL